MGLTLNRIFFVSYFSFGFKVGPGHSQQLLPTGLRGQGRPPLRGQVLPNEGPAAAQNLQTQREDGTGNKDNKQILKQTLFQYFIHRIQRLFPTKPMN